MTPGLRKASSNSGPRVPSQLQNIGDGFNAGGQRHAFLGASGFFAHPGEVAQRDVGSMGHSGGLSNPALEKISELRPAFMTTRGPGASSVSDMPQLRCRRRSIFRWFVDVELIVACQGQPAGVHGGLAEYRPQLCRLVRSGYAFSAGPVRARGFAVAGRRGHPSGRVAAVEATARAFALSSRDSARTVCGGNQHVGGCDAVPGGCLNRGARLRSSCWASGWRSPH